jgi:hypothetical protein
MSTDPYYSSAPGEPEVYHDHRECPVGRGIPILRRRHGTNDMARCLYCISMDTSDTPPLVVGAA